MVSPADALQDAGLDQAFVEWIGFAPLLVNIARIMFQILTMVLIKNIQLKDGHRLIQIV